MTIRPLLVLLVLLACAFAPAARAAITCEVVSDTDMNYGTAPMPIGPGTATTQITTVRCTGNGFDRGSSVRVCIALLPSTSPRRMTHVGPPPVDPTSTVTHRIYRDPAYAQEINFTSVNAERIFTIPATGNPSQTATLTMYGRLQGSSVGPVAGTYVETVPAAMGSGTSTLGCNAIPVTTAFTYEARTQITASCTINAADLSFGTVNLLSANIDASTTLGINCTSGRAYTVRLNGGTVTGNVAARRMGPGGVAPGAVDYQLRHTAANGPLWGDGTGGTTTLTGTGTGASQNVTLYGRVPGGQPAPAVGTYSDTVTASVEF